MSTLWRKIIICLIGLLGGAAAWSMAEVMLMMQSKYPSYLIFTVSLGALFGAVMGLFFGSIEGITLSIPERISRGIIGGLVIGAIGGGIGFITSQAVLFLIEDLTRTNQMLHAMGVPVSRTIGWMILGCFVGMIEGIRSKSGSRIAVGVIGGSIGGLAGGVVLEFLPRVTSEPMLFRLAGLIIMGGAVAFCYSMIEGSFSQGVLKLLNGALKGKEYLLVQKNITIGSEGKASIRLQNYDGLDAIHANMHISGEGYKIESADEKRPIKVNDQPIKDHYLKFQDVIQIGTAKFLFYYK